MREIEHPAEIPQRDSHRRSPTIVHTIVCIPIIQLNSASPARIEAAGWLHLNGQTPRV